MNVHIYIYFIYTHNIHIASLTKFHLLLNIVVKYLLKMWIYLNLTSLLMSTNINFSIFTIFIFIFYL